MPALPVARPSRSAWLPLVRQLMGQGLTMSQAIDHLAHLAVAQHQTQAAQQASVRPIDGPRLVLSADDEALQQRGMQPHPITTLPTSGGQQ